MSGRGRPPKPPNQRRSHRSPGRGEYQTRDLIGWQYGDPPRPPKGISAAAVETWGAWMASWFAAYWEPADVPGLHLVITLYSRVARGAVSGAERAELRQWMDSYGITKKGQQDRRWVKPAVDTGDAAAIDAGALPGGPYDHLRLVGEDD